MKLESRPTSASLLQWTKLRGTCPVLLIGKRSAAFAPLDNLGLVIIFEEDDRSYKQDQSPHYHVHDVIAMRQRIEGFKTIYVSQAPTAETWYEAKKNKWKVIEPSSKDPLVPGTPSGRAQVQMINMDNYDKQKGYILSPPVMNDIQNCIAQKKRILLFFNKKSKTVIGENKAGIMAPYLSTGVEKLATTVSKLFPEAIVAKYQKETSSLNGRANVVIATQAILRLRYQEKFDYVVFLNVDAELSHMNFRSSHITYALLTRLKAMARERLSFQTRMPNNYVIASFSKGEPGEFYKEELNIREQLKFPPYAHIVAIKLRAKKEDAVKKTSKEIFEALKEKVPEDIELVDPYAEMMGAVLDKFKYTILLKGPDVKRILAFVKETLPNIKNSGNVIVTFDVDP
jgi:primosomal protein N' (replication factor Y)